MIAYNIWRLIGDFFTWAFGIFEWMRLGEFNNWWASNIVSGIFIVIFLVLFAYWMKESARFKREGIEDKA